MPQPKKAARFGGSPSHHNMILANLATELIRHGRVTTTLAKARNVQPLAERRVADLERQDDAAREETVELQAQAAEVAVVHLGLAHRPPGVDPRARNRARPRRAPRRSRRHRPRIAFQGRTHQAAQFGSIRFAQRVEVTGRQRLQFAHGIQPAIEEMPTMS